MSARPPFVVPSAKHGSEVKCLTSECKGTVKVEAKVLKMRFCESCRSAAAAHSPRQCVACSNPADVGLACKKCRWNGTLMITAA